MSSPRPESEHLPVYEQSQFEGEKPPCDLIMKGGITSGVVYPFAITEVATGHRFVNVGGTSAGAIAAGIAAAAEYDRAGGGFIRLAEIPADVGQRLLSLFQPAPRYRAVFRTFLSALGDKSLPAKAVALIGAALFNHWFVGLLGLIPAGLLAAHAAATDAGWSVWAVIVLLAFLGPALAVVTRAALTVLIGLPQTRFGICPGIRQPGEQQPGLTDWLAQTIERVAGRVEANAAMPQTPLTFGELQSRGINLEVMTTNLSMRRPYSLPQTMKEFVWRQRDFDALFPDWVVRYLLDVCKPAALADVPDGYRFPDPQALPVIVAVRMSLSFPVLLAAVPLLTRDHTYRLDAGEQHRARLCWFSDGGISSNFPIHFFDSLWPSHPTFAITLDEFHEARHGPEDDRDKRVHMPQSAGTGMLIPVADIVGVPAFLYAIVNAAKEWQDVMQSILPGYRERIAHIALTETEGGLNLTMPQTKVERLSMYGYGAGRAMLGFDFDEHRWRRYLVALARIEGTLHELKLRYDGGYQSFLDHYPANAKSYKQEQQWLDEALQTTRSLMTMAGANIADPLRGRGKIPKPETDMRVAPRV